MWSDIEKTRNALAGQLLFYISTTHGTDPYHEKNNLILLKWWKERVVIEHGFDNNEVPDSRKVKRFDN